MTTDSKMPRDQIWTNPRHHERGSVLLATVIVLALLTTMGLILLFSSQTEVRMSVADATAKQAFYLAETGTETGRETLRLALVAARSSALSPRLDLAAGSNDAIDLDTAAIRPVYSGSTVTGFSGTGDDVPLVAPTQIDGGWYAAYMTNDPADGEANLTDSNEFVMITGVGVGQNGAVEVAQAIVRPGTLFPPIPATITLLGPDPEFEYKSGKGWADIECPKAGSKVWIAGVEVKGSKLSKGYNGTDCPPYRKVIGLGPDGKNPELGDTGGTGGLPGVYMPVIGVVGATAESDVEGELKGSKMFYLSDMPIRTAVLEPTVPTGNYQNEDTVADLTDATEPTVAGSGLGALSATWTNCTAVKNIVESLRANADFTCSGSSCTLPTMTPSTLAFIDGDYHVPCDYEGFGMLVVTGELDVPLSSSWHGIIFAIGEGKFYRPKKEGHGNISGGVIVADIAGPDDTYGNADDCTGGSGGFDSVVYHDGKKGFGSTVYCSADIMLADPGFREPTVITSFRQE